MMLESEEWMSIIVIEMSNSMSSMIMHRIIGFSSLSLPPSSHFRLENDHHIVL